MSLLTADRQGIAVTSGFYESGDGGGNTFFWDPSRPKTDHNGGTVIDPDTTIAPGEPGWWTTTSVSGTGCWVAVDDSTVHPEQFGAKGDGITDDTDAFQAAVSGNIVIARNSYLITGIQPTSGTKIFGEYTGVIILADGSSTDSPIELKDVSNIDIIGLEVKDDFSQTNKYGILAHLSDNVEQTNINIIGCKVHGFSKHGIAIHGYNPSVANDTYAGFTHVVVKDNNVYDNNSIDIIFYGNIEKGKIVNNTCDSAVGISIKVDVFSKDIVCSENTTYGDIGAEGGCENITVTNNNSGGKVFFGSGTVTTDLGGNGKPWYPVLHSVITSNVCAAIEAAGHYPHDASKAGDPYAWIARPQGFAEDIIILGNTLKNASSDGLVCSNIKNAVVVDNVIEGTVNYGIRITSCKQISVHNNLVTDCGTTTDNSILVTGNNVTTTEYGTVDYGTENIVLSHNTVINDTVAKTSPEVKLDSYVSGVVLDGNTIDPGTTNVSAYSLQLDQVTNITLRNKTTFVNQAATNNYSLNAPSFVAAPNQTVSDKIPLNTAFTQTLVPSVNSRVGIAKAFFVYETAAATGTVATIQVGRPSQATRNVNNSSLATSQSMEQQDLTIIQGDSGPGEVVQVNIVAGTTDGEGRLIVEWGEI